MAEKTVGIHQLKAQLSEYIREIKKGNTVLITVRGNAVGRMIATSKSLEERMESIVRSEIAAAKIKSGSKTLAEIVSEDRN